MTGFRAIEEHVVPKLRAAAETAGRPEPRTIAGMHVALTNEPDIANAQMEKMLEQYRMMPSYKANIDREGSMTPADFALIGDEKALDAQLDRLRDIGVTDLDANILETEEGGRKRTLDYLQSRLGGRG